MTDLKNYVDDLFRHQKLTGEVRDLKEEILSSMTAKMEELKAQGIEGELAVKAAKESLTDIDGLIEGSQLTTRHTLYCYFGLFLTGVFGVALFLRTREQKERVGFLSVTKKRKRDRMVWLVCGYSLCDFACE